MTYRFNITSKRHSFRLTGYTVAGCGSYEEALAIVRKQAARQYDTQMVSIERAGHERDR